jgi:hypothetical protein
MCPSGYPVFAIAVDGQVLPVDTISLWDGVTLTSDPPNPPSGHPVTGYINLTLEASIPDELATGTHMFTLVGTSPNDSIKDCFGDKPVIVEASLRT